MTSAQWLRSKMQIELSAVSDDDDLLLRLVSRARAADSSSRRGLVKEKVLARLNDLVVKPLLRLVELGALLFLEMLFYVFGFFVVVDSVKFVLDVKFNGCSSLCLSVFLE